MKQRKRGNKMKDKMILNDTEFYGLLNGIDIQSAEKIAETLHKEVDCRNFEKMTEGKVVEEIIRRGGTFLTRTEVEQILPKKIKDNGFVRAWLGFLGGKEVPEGYEFSESDWVTLDMTQYIYGMYLLDRIELGALSIEEMGE